jgi:hypothetical protein
MTLQPSTQPSPWETDVVRVAILRQLLQLWFTFHQEPVCVPIGA